MMTAQRSTARKDAGLQLTQTPHPRHREQREAIQKKQRWFDIFWIAARFFKPLARTIFVRQTYRGKASLNKTGSPREGETNSPSHIT